MDARLKNGITKYLESMGYNPTALFDAWKLGPGSGWENVAEHCLVQAGAHVVFGPMIELSNIAINNLIPTSLGHDATKRHHKKPTDFLPKEIEYAYKLLGMIEPDFDQIHNVLSPRFIPKFVVASATLEDRVLFIVDDMARDGDIVSFDDRIDENSARNPDPEPAIREKLGRPYWDVEREVGHIILTGLLVMLRERGFKVKTMADIPRLINAEMWKKFVG